jgi:hypothetical protein
MRVEGFRRPVISAVRTPPGLDLEIPRGRANGCRVSILVARVNAMQKC